MFTPRLKGWKHKWEDNANRVSVTDRVLPKIRRRALEKPIEASPRPVRQNPPRSRQPTVRAKEIRRSRCAREIPEILPLSGFVAMVVAVVYVLVKNWNG
jgi:cytochrome c-type biogenesis protein CcmH/NrfG